jgi:hypothetical protein
MNVSAMNLVPTPPAAVVLRLEPAADLEVRHRNMIRGVSALSDAVMEDLTEDNITHIQALIAQFQADLAYCSGHQAAAMGKVGT